MAKFENAGIFLPKTGMLFVAGFLLSLFGSLPPGLISLSVAQTAIARTMRAAIILAFGAAFAEFFQAWVAVVLSDWFLQHPQVERYFQWGAIPVFWGLALYLFFIARPPKTADSVVAYNVFSQFSKGILISMFNLLAIPYWFVYCGWLHVEGWWPDNDFFSTVLFSVGVSTGTMCVLALYAVLGREIVRRSDRMAFYANRIVACIFFLLGLQVLYGLFLS
ncbi:MAG: LysE family transporter [Bacteroidota bacterium]